MTDAPDLEPAALEACPFCGERQMHIEHADGVYLTHRCHGRSDRPVIKIVDQTEDRVRAAWNRRAARSAPEAGKAVAKPLIWEAREKPDLNGNRYWRAQTTFDWGYRIYFEDSRYVIRGGDKDFATLDEAKAAAQADFEQRILSALASSPAPTGAEPVAIRRAAIEDVLDLLTAHELYRYRPKAFDGFVAYARTELAAASPQPAPTGEIAGMATVIQGLRNRATAAERKLEEAERELDAAKHLAISLSKRLDDADYGFERDTRIHQQSRAEAAERKLEEARKALERAAVAAYDEPHYLGPEGMERGADGLLPPGSPYDRGRYDARKAVEVVTRQALEPDNG